MDLRDIALKALEEKRSIGLIGSSIEASISLQSSNKELVNVLNSLEKDELARLFGVSEAIVAEGSEKAEVSKDDDEICERCRNHKKDAIKRENGAILCDRCAKALGE